MRNKRQLTVRLLVVAEPLIDMLPAIVSKAVSLCINGHNCSQMKQQRKEVADLIRANKQGNARIRVEAVIRDHQTLQAYELIELFLELMAVRVQLIEKTKEMPSDMAEAMSSLIYASHRLPDFQELGAIRAMLGSKYGKEYVQEATSDLMCRKWHVNEDLIRRVVPCWWILLVLQLPLPLYTKSRA